MVFKDSCFRPVLVPASSASGPDLTGSLRPIILKDELYAEFQEWLSEGPNAGALKHSGDEYIILGGAQMDRAGARSLVRLRGAVGEYLKTGNRELGNRLA